MTAHLKKKLKIDFPLIVIISVLLFSSAFSQDKAYVKKNEFYPGDALSISFIDIYRENSKGSVDFSGEYAIDSRGYIMLPLVGAVKVVGYNRYTLAEKLVEVLKPFSKEPYIAITPLIRITISGPFYKPGAYRVSPQLSLWDALEKAGGPQGNCDLNSISVVRNDETVIEHLLAGFEKGYSLEDIGVQSGDQIVAKAKRHLGAREIFDYVRFGMNIVSLYILILRWQSYSK